MLRERALNVVLVLLGLFFCAGIYPIAEALWHPNAAEDYGDYMMLSLYVTLGVFLLIASPRKSRMPWPPTSEPAIIASGNVSTNDG